MTHINTRPCHINRDLRGIVEQTPNDIAFRYIPGCQYWMTQLICCRGEDITYFSKVIINLTLCCPFFSGLTECTDGGGTNLDEFVFFNDKIIIANFVPQ